MTTPTQKQSETLKPCPFCGSSEIYEGDQDLGNTPSSGVFFGCSNCSAKADYFSYYPDWHNFSRQLSYKEATEKAKAAWNTRAQPSETPVGDKVREALEHYKTVCERAAKSAGNPDYIEQPATEALALIDQQAARLPQNTFAQFGAGKLVIVDGKYEGKPAVFIGDNGKSGEVGSLVAEEDKLPENRLKAPEIVLMFPTEDQAKRVAKALCNDNPLADLAAKVEGMRVVVPAVPWIGDDYKQEKWTEVHTAIAHNAALDAVLDLIGKAGEV